MQDSCWPAAVNQALGKPAEALGQMGSVAIAWFAFPPLGAFLLDAGGLSLPFLVLAGLLLRCLPGVRLIDEPLGFEAPRRDVRVLLSRRAASTALLLSASLQTMFGAFEARWSRYFKDLGASPRFIGVSLRCTRFPWWRSPHAADALRTVPGPSGPPSWPTSARCRS